MSESKIRPFTEEGTTGAIKMAMAIDDGRTERTRARMDRASQNLLRSTLSFLECEISDRAHLFSIKKGEM